jgi:hypothetical protein
MTTGPQTMTTAMTMMTRPHHDVSNDQQQQQGLETTCLEPWYVFFFFFFIFCNSTNDYLSIDQITTTTTTTTTPSPRPQTTTTMTRPLCQKLRPEPSQAGARPSLAALARPRFLQSRSRLRPGQSCSFWVKPGLAHHSLSHPIPFHPITSYHIPGYPTNLHMLFT